ncbi:MAG: redox-sensing transcriptional repressor Rex [Clostridiales Family XIII bacterium]|jgi:redox-sensing transcriptional repressor|nr:redox-sensing transcriptional repressor Rex [Clostridiales Family XIII bacterium]
MKQDSKISPAVIKRLPRYRRYLSDLQKKGLDRISSNKLSELVGFSASQIRQDLNNFGGFGQQGYGYNVKELNDEIAAILGIDREYSLVMVGLGNLGQAIANYNYFYKSGFVVKAMFDINPKIVGSQINDITVDHIDNLPKYLRTHNIDIGVISTEKESAQGIAEVFVEGKIKGIWNFAPTYLDVPDDVVLEDVHLSDSLWSLAYYINEQESES